MTYFRPQRISINLFLIMLIVLIFVSALLNVYIYSQIVDSKYKIQGLDKQIDAISVKNIDLGKQIYQLLDFKAPHELAAEYNLVKDSRPDYLVSVLGR